MPVAHDLSLAEWIVLALVDEQPRHGFAIAALTADDGEIGRVWTVGKPIVYRALARLAELELVRVDAMEFGGRGPQRSVLRATRSGAAAVRRWLARPVAHLRDTRSEFLIKLALLHRRAASGDALVAGQREHFAPMADALLSRVERADGFARVLASWRAENAAAVLRFLDGLP